MTNLDDLRDLLARSTPKRHVCDMPICCHDTLDNGHNDDILALFDAAPALIAELEAARRVCEITPVHSTSHMTHYLTRLERFGCIRRDYSIARSIVIVEAQP